MDTPFHVSSFHSYTDTCPVDIHNIQTVGPDLGRPQLSQFCLRGGPHFRKTPCQGITTILKNLRSDYLY